MPLGINRVFRCNLLREQLVIVVFVQHSLHVELLAVSQLLAYLARVNGLHIDIDLGGLCPGELGLLPLLFKIRLLHIAQRPERVELNLDLRDLIHFTGGEAGLEDDRQQITQVALEHPALNSFDIVVVVSMLVSSVELMPPTAWPNRIVCGILDNADSILQDALTTSLMPLNWKVLKS